MQAFKPKPSFLLRSKFKNLSTSFKQDLTWQIMKLGGLFFNTLLLIYCCRHFNYSTWLNKLVVKIWVGTVIFPHLTLKKQLLQPYKRGTQNTSDIDIITNSLVIQKYNEKRKATPCSSELDFENIETNQKKNTMDDSIIYLA